MKKGKMKKIIVGALSTFMLFTGGFSVAAMDEGTSGESSNEQIISDEDIDTALYDSLMAAETAEAMGDILEEFGEQPSFTSEQLSALIAKAEAFEEDADGERAGILSTLTGLTAVGVKDNNENNKKADSSNYDGQVQVVETAQITSVTAVEITDSISTDGRYTIKVTANETTTYTGEEAADILKASGYTVSWTMGGTAITLGQKLSTTSGDQLASDGDGGWVNVGLLQGGEKTFVVTISKGGTTAATASKTCNYSAEIKNWSFETPSANSVSKTDKTNVYTTSNNGGEPYYWQTTAGQAGTGWNGGNEADYIEIGTTSGTWVTNTENSSGGLHAYGPTSVSSGTGSITTPDGTQYAELNAEKAGALYQTVLTMPGQTMNWQFYHRARSYGNGTPLQAGKSDRMSMLIVPEELAVALNITTQDALERFYGSLTTYGNNDGTFTYNYSGKTYTIYICDDTSTLKEKDNVLYSEWNYRHGKFTVPEGQYLSRFFFMAQSTASDKKTVGNLLDAVWFSQTPAPVAQGTARVTVTKKVYGLEQKDATSILNKTDLINYKVDSDTPKNITLENVTYNSAGKYWEGTYSIEVTGLESQGEEKTITITENIANNNADVPGYTRKTEVQVGSADALKNNSTSVTVTYENNSASVTLINTYTSSTATLSIKKLITGSMGDKSKKFSFTVVSNEGLTVGSTSIDANTAKDFTLTNYVADTDNDYEITVPVGATVTITESPSGYEHSSEVKDVNGSIVDTTVEGTDKGASTYSVTFTMPSTNTTATFTNNKNGSPDTGIFTDMSPYIAMLGIVAVGTVIMMFTHKHRHVE